MVLSGHFGASTQRRNNAVGQTVVAFLDPSVTMYKIKWSNFHVTVNLNASDRNNIDALREAIEAMPTEDCRHLWLRGFDGTAQYELSETDFEDHVDSIRLRAAIECEGPQNKGLHVHIVVEVGHDIMVQISKDGVVRVFRRFLPHCNPSVHCEFIRGEGDSKPFILKYLQKEVPPKSQRSTISQRRLAAAMANEVIADEEEDL